MSSFFETVPVSAHDSPLLVNQYESQPTLIYFSWIMAMSLQILQKPRRAFAEETTILDGLRKSLKPVVEQSASVSAAASQWESCPEAEELETEIVSGTHQQVRNIKVRCDHAGITVYGVSSSYYLKQLVTTIVQTFAPSVPLMNRVMVKVK